MGQTCATNQQKRGILWSSRTEQHLRWYEGSKPCQLYQNHGGFPWPKLNTWPREIQNQAAVSAMEDRPSVRLSFSSCLSVQNSKDPQRHQIPDGFRCFEARKHQVGMALDFSWFEDHDSLVKWRCPKISKMGVTPSIVGTPIWRNPQMSLEKNSIIWLWLDPSSVERLGKISCCRMNQFQLSFQVGLWICLKGSWYLPSNVSSIQNPWNFKIFGTL